MNHRMTKIAFLIGTTLLTASAYAQQGSATPTDESAQAGQPQSSSGTAYSSNAQDRTSSASSQGHEGMQNSSTANASHDNMTGTSATSNTRVAHNSAGTRSRPTFENLDKNHDGNLSADELTAAGTVTGCDSDGDHRVSADEYARCSK